MTFDEATKIVELLAFAHGGCGECVRDMLAHFFRAFPDLDYERLLLGLIREGILTEKVAGNVRRVVMLKILPRKIPNTH